jgi:hypothetical protein
MDDAAVIIGMEKVPRYKMKKGWVSDFIAKPIMVMIGYPTSSMRGARKRKSGQYNE